MGKLESEDFLWMNALRRRLCMGHKRVRNDEDAKAFLLKADNAIMRMHCGMSVQDNHNINRLKWRLGVLGVKE